MIRPLTSALTPTRYPWAALLIASGLLGGAWFFQYVLGYAPCQMCYWQRQPHKIIILLALIAFIVLHFKGEKAPSVSFAGLLALAFLVSTGLGLWHVGVELGMLEGPKSCASGPVNMNEINGDDLMASLDKKIKPPACSDVVWSFLGLSMAGWNALVSFGGFVLGAISLRKGATS